MWNKVGLVSLALFALSAAHAAEKGIIRIVTEPGEAQITVNGDPKGTSPGKIGETFAIKLDEGNYTIEASKNGISKKKDIFVAADTTKTVSISLKRYIDNHDGTVTDTETNLMWKQCSEGQSGSSCSGKVAEYTWDDAKSKFGSGVSFASHSDWRMPTKDELKSLVYCSNGTPQATAWDKGCGDNYQRPTIDQTAFPNTAQWGYWSSTEKDASGAWVVYFVNGLDYWGNRGPDRAVRLVRSGQ